MDFSTPGLPAHHQLPEFTQFMSIESVMQFNHLILCHPLFLLPSIIPSIRVFSNESVLLIRRSNQSILKEISPEYSLEGLMLKPKLQYFGHLLGRSGSLEKTLMLGKIEVGRKRG